MWKPTTNTPAKGEEASSDKAESLIARFIRWLFPDQRSSARHLLPPVVAYLGAIRLSKTYQVGDVSLRGFYILTSERWLLGSMFPVTLQRIDIDEDDPAGTITVQATVVRLGTDGTGFEFAVPEPMANESRDADSGLRMFQASLTKFFQGLNLPSREEANNIGVEIC
jgi:hypothetical protein